ncbi:MAG: PilZ domain-containing protein [Methylococcaceae bacterium]
MAEAAQGQGILSLSIKDKNALYMAYMPFVTNGGLFIPTSRQYEMGQEVFMLLNLMDETERLPIAGTIIWITPPGSEGFRAVGVGVQFSDQDNGISRNKIENYLAGSLQHDRVTHTM